MRDNKPKLCLCGMPGVVWKNNDWVCERCHRIELHFYGRRKVTAGQKKFPNTGQYKLSESEDVYGDR